MKLCFVSDADFARIKAVPFVFPDISAVGKDHIDAIVASLDHTLGFEMSVGDRDKLTMMHSLLLLCDGA